MPGISPEDLWDHLYEEIGEDLRGVVRYESNTRDMVLRDDVRDAYSNIEDRKVVDDAIITQLSFDKSQSIFKVGDLIGNVKIFEEAWVLQYPDPFAGKTGYIVSIQRTGGNTTIAGVEECIRILDESTHRRTS